MKLRIALVTLIASLALAAQSPLGFKVGDLQFTPGGFLDFTTVFRSTDVGSGVGTNFAAIPYNDTVAGRLTELRESAQNSRLSLKVTAQHDTTEVLGYLETDFLGNQPSNAAVSSNSATMRLRVYFVDLRNGRWEVLAGQDWGFLTPNRTGLSPMPSNIFYTLDQDTNYQVGLTWTRQPQFRLIFHATSSLAAGISIEQGEPYIGGSAGAGQAVLPGGPGGVYGSQVDNGASNFSAPGFTPDVIGKLAWDTRAGAHAVHLELAGLYSEFRALTPATNLTSHAAGGGLGASANFALTPRLRLVASGLVGDGAGRYFFGTMPDMVIRQNGEVSPVRSHGGVAGLEYTLSPAYTFFGYYGRVTAAPDYDLRGAAPVGYGFAGAPTSMNRELEEYTVGGVRTLWKSPQYGALQLILQASYVARRPFAASVPAASGAHAGLGYADLRFTLP
ncbi:MAG: hypothetical protein ACRD01_11485 [Terriglobales bacterium]